MKYRKIFDSNAGMKKILFIISAMLCVVTLVKSAYAEELPEIYIKAVNPGYSVDGVSNVGEMIEIGRRKNSDEPFSLTGYSISYTNSSGNSAVLVEFPEHSWMVGETILLRLASSPGHELANLVYAKTLAAKAGPLELKHGDEILDSICWTGKDGCYKEFKTTSPTTLVRNMETNEFEHMAEYVPEFSEENYREDVVVDEPLPSQCKGLVFSEILTYYDNSKDEQFVEIYNSSSEQILTTGCRIRYKNKMYDMNGTIKPEEYRALYFSEISFTKNPTNKNVVEIVDTNGETTDKLEVINGQRKGTSYALIGYDADGKEIWKVTYAPTPNAPNNYQEFKTCESGKVLNKETGNCVKVTEVLTKVCKDGYFLNVLTGRCNKIKSVEKKVCKEGYALNEETGRCVKIKENNGADYKLKDEKFDEKSMFIAIGAIVIVVAVGLIYVVYEFRKEILMFLRKVFRRSP